MKSMTGYGAVRQHLKDGSIEVIAQSFNGKFLEIHTQLSSIYASEENSIKNHIKKIFRRGNVKIIINRTPPFPIQALKMTWNDEQALKWKTLYHNMARRLKMQNNLDLISLAQQPGVLNCDKTFLVSNQEKQIVIRLAKKASQLCDKERAREGQSLKKIFQVNIKKLERCLKVIKTLALNQKKQIQKKINKKDYMIHNVNNKATQDISTLISRLDVDEELIRMKEHTKTCSLFLSSKQAIGKKMNFYLQEMIREINTIGSKSQNFKLTNEVVSAKSYIETMREQIQNVE